jgi:potassium efflux system protein
MSFEMQNTGGGGQWPRRPLGLFMAQSALAPWIEPGNGFWSRLTELFQKLVAVWSYQVASIDGRPLTVGKVVIAVLIIVVGVPTARVVTRRTARRILARVGITHATTEASATIGFYIALAGILVFALWMAEIPLTIFAFAGGALAIGIGFGSQNVLNNFISGLILLAERPIKIGDLVEVNETFGQVESIGARSTSIKTFDNFHIIVPNSTFLESNVINWTHTDTLVRISLVVGVAYGSPVEKVEQIMLEIVREHDRSVIPPEPVVLFDDFGDSALIFRALFWIEMKRPMDQRLALSDLRFRLDKRFREEGITIAFPQRDLHLDTLRPLDVHLV